MTQNTEPAPWLRPLPGGKHVSALGFGCSSVWAAPTFSDETADAIIDAAIAEGINHFDTGPSYGVGERRVGAFLRRHNRDPLVIATKVGTNLIDNQIVRGFTPDLMQRSFDDSLRRLGTDYVDILYLHGPAIRDLNDESFTFFDRLKKSGRIIMSAVNSFDNMVLDKVVNTPIDAVMLQYNVVDQSSYRQIDRLNSAGKIVMSGTVLGRVSYRPSALIPRDRASLWYLARMIKNDPMFMFHARRMSRKLASTGKPDVEAAIQFATGHPGIVSHLFGTSRLAHLIANARAGHGTLTSDQRSALVR